MTVEGVDMDEDVTLAASALGATSDETMTAEDELAWSAEEYAVDISQPRRHWPLWAALALVLSLVTGAAVWLATVFYQQEWGQPHGVAIETPKAPVPAPPPVETPKPLPAPGPPVQHENTPPEPPPNPDPDRQFLALVAEIPGVVITDPQLEISETKVVCSELRQGATPDDIISATLREAPSLSRAQAERLFDVGTTVYCPKFSR